MMEVAVPLGLFGLIFCLLGVRFGSTYRRFRRRAERASGTVVSRRVSLGSSGGMSAPAPPFSDGTVIPNAGGSGSSRAYYPTVSFTTRDGTEVTAECKVATNPAPRVGRQVTVLYDPADPQDVRIDSLLARGGCLPWVFVLFGSLAIAVAVGIGIAVS